MDALIGKKQSFTDAMRRNEIKNEKTFDQPHYYNFALAKAVTNQPNSINLSSTPSV
jgi:hypothetical protein